MLPAASPDVLLAELQAVLLSYSEGQRGGGVLWAMGQRGQPSEKRSGGCRPLDEVGGWTQPASEVLGAAVESCS